jgi:hypothetical protein
VKDAEPVVARDPSPPRLSEPLLRLLAEAAEKTGMSEEEILRLCLEYGIEKILAQTETKPAA